MHRIRMGGCQTMVAPEVLRRGDLASLTWGTADHTRCPTFLQLKTSLPDTRTACLTRWWCCVDMAIFTHGLSSHLSRFCSNKRLTCQLAPVHLNILLPSFVFWSVTFSHVISLKMLVNL